MFDLPLIFLGGLLGSAHCVGMCGGFAVMLGAGTPTWRVNLARQCVYSCGRIFTYAAMGAVVGYAGLRFIQLMPPLVDVQAWMALLAGGFLIVQGLISAGVLSIARAALASALRSRPHGGTSNLVRLPGVVPCLAPGLFGGLLRPRGHKRRFWRAW